MDLDIGTILDKQYKTTRGLIIALIVSVAALIVTNLAWVWLWNQYDYETTITTTTEWEVVQDGEGTNTIEGSFNEWPTEERKE